MMAVPANRNVLTVDQLRNAERLQAWRIKYEAAQHKQVCAWCLKVLRDGKRPVSHGICAECAEEMEEA